MPSTFRAAGINTTTVYKERRIPGCAVFDCSGRREFPPGVRDIGVRDNGEFGVREFRRASSKVTECGASRARRKGRSHSSLLTSDGPLHRLAGQADPGAPAERISFGGEPETARVPFVPSDGEARFADSGTGP